MDHEFNQGRQMAIHAIGHDEFSEQLARDLLNTWSDRRGSYAMGVIFTARMRLTRNPRLTTGDQERQKP